MGRDEDSSDHDLAAFYYPALQAADIFELEVDIAFGAWTRESAHVHARGCGEESMDKADMHPHSMLSGLKGQEGGWTPLIIKCPSQIRECDPLG